MKKTASVQNRLKHSAEKILKALYTKIPLASQLFEEPVDTTVYGTYHIVIPNRYVRHFYCVLHSHAIPGKAVLP
jgi:hypothetical protein